MRCDVTSRVFHVYIRISQCLNSNIFPCAFVHSSWQCIAELNREEKSEREKKRSKNFIASHIFTAIVVDEIGRQNATFLLPLVSMTMNSRREVISYFCLSNDSLSPLLCTNTMCRIKDNEFTRNCNIVHRKILFVVLVIDSLEV